jgi:hypothetical protein
MRLRIVACEIFFRELCHLAARSPRTVDVDFLPKGLHDQGGGVMRGRLQAAIDATDPGKHDAVALAYGLCNNGLVGLEARTVPLVLLRAHDCITAFLGSRSRYARVFEEKPGTYFETTGWLERGVDGGPYGLPRQTGALGFDLDVLVEKYGEDNARYILQTMTQHYRRLAFIRMGVEPDGSFEERTRELATEREWQFEVLDGDLGLLRRLVDGPWSAEDFLVLQPGQRAASTLGHEVIVAEPASDRGRSAVSPPSAGGEGPR